MTSNHFTDEDVECAKLFLSNFFEHYQMNASWRKKFTQAVLQSYGERVKNNKPTTVTEISELFLFSETTDGWDSWFKVNKWFRHACDFERIYMFSSTCPCEVFGLAPVDIQV